MPYVTRATPPPAGTRGTMKDVAAALGVSTATVSRALQDDPAISAATKSAVLEVAQRVQYRPSAAARRLRTQSASLVGVVVQSVGDGYIGDVVLGSRGRARELGYQPLFFAAEGQPGLESEALDVFLSEHVPQLIAVSPTGKPQLLRRAVAEGMRVAVINGDQSVPARHFAEVATGNADGKILKIERARNSLICHIRFDGAAAGRLATEYLISLGHRTCVHLRGSNVRSGLLRLLGFREALTTAGMWPQPVLSPRAPVMQHREDAVTQYLRAVSPPVAMVAYDDLCAMARPRVLDGQLVIRESAGPPSRPAGGGREPRR